MVITIAGFIGGGKSSLAKILSEHLNSEAFYESVDDNPILPLFYTASKEEISLNRYPFLLQLWFLNTRFKSIKKALVDKNNVLDRSIYEDLYFCQVNYELGRISELEFEIYKSLLNNMLEELDELPKKAPDLMVYLKGNFETFLSRIVGRGREYELDEELYDYYYKLWQGYDNWIQEYYTLSEVVVIDIDKYDYVNNQEDKKEVLKLITDALNTINE